MLLGTPDKSDRRQSQNRAIPPSLSQSAWKLSGLVFLSLVGLFAFNAAFSTYMHGRLLLAGITVPIMIWAIYGRLGLGHGCNFSVTLLLSEGLQESMQLPDLPMAQHQNAAEGKSLDILLVDANRDSAQPWTMLLQFEGHWVTGYGAEQVIAGAYNSGFDQLIGKPIDADLLLEELQLVAQRGSVTSSPSSLASNS